MMLLERQGQVREVPSAVIGFVEPEVFAGKSYGMILHRELHKLMGWRHGNEKFVFETDPHAG